MHSPDITQENVVKLLKLFPNCKTEKYNEDSDLDELETGIDFDLLKQELSKNIVEGPKERYQLNWPGKREALLTANASVAKTLRPCRKESVNFDSTKNLFIEGDNLDALKLLQENYLGKVKMIYIDPPYNTGNDFIYRDKFVQSSEDYLSDSGQKDKEGNRLVTNTESKGRFHSDWLSMMYPRLKLARNLLRDDGVIFISIDDNEVANLRKVCDEIFSSDNFISELLWVNNERGRSIDKFISNTNESILMFAKDHLSLTINLFREKGEEIQNQYPLEDNKSRYKKGDPLYNNNTKFNIETRPNLVYSIYINKNTEEYRCVDEKAKCSDGSLELHEKNLFGDKWIKVIPPFRKNIQKLGCWRWSKDKFMSEAKSELLLIQQKNGTYMFFSKNRLTESGEKLSKFKNIIQGIHGGSGTNEMTKLLDGKYFDHPKPVQFVHHLLKIASLSQDIILDFFAGSSTTAHATMQLNAEDSGNRQFIMVQLPEPCGEKSEAFKAGYKTIAEISKERIRRAGTKIKQENPNAKDLDIGFRVLKVDSSNMNDVSYTPDKTHQADMFARIEHIKKDRSDEDLLFQVMLDWGLELTLPVRKETILKKTVYFVGDDELIACFAKKDITEKLIKELATFKPLRIVFRDDGFVSDSVKINAEQIFKQLASDTDFKVI